MATQQKFSLNAHCNHPAGGLAASLSRLGWSLFLIWIGIALLNGISEGTGLLVAGIIPLGIQGLRKYYGLKPKGFWVAIGGLFILGGLWKLFEVGKPLAPVILIIVGLALAVSLFKMRKGA